MKKASLVLAAILIPLSFSAFAMPEADKQYIDGKIQNLEGKLSALQEQINTLGEAIHTDEKQIATLQEIVATLTDHVTSQVKSLRESLAMLLKKQPQ